MTETEPLYQVEIKCMLCGQGYRTSKVRPSFKKGYQTDSDFCIHYKEINPEYYIPRVCPHCGFASVEGFSRKIGDTQRQMFEERVTNRWIPYNYGGERKWGEAMQAYKLSLLCAQIKGEAPRVLSNLLHRIAWMYRYKDDKEQETKFLRFALEAYVQMYETDEMETSAARLMYMIGELNRRLGDFYEAVRWFSRVVNDKRIMDAGMIRASREMWQTAREEMRQLQMEVPEEAKLIY